MIPVLLITGPVGVGKTAVIGAITDLLKKTAARFASIDLDQLSYAYPPAPGDDRFRSGLMFTNLASVWRNDRAAGAERLVLAGVIESRDDLARYQDAIPGAQITVVRLRASDGVLQERLLRRETGDGLAWHSARARELGEIMDRAAIEDLLVETDGRTLNEIAREVLTRAAWLPVA
jgi:hypothetical protein